MGIKFKIGIFVILIASLGIGMTGCYKKLSEYDCIWISEDNCIQLDSATGKVILNIDGVDNLEGLMHYLIMVKQLGISRITPTFRQNLQAR